MATGFQSDAIPGTGSNLLLGDGRLGGCFQFVAVYGLPPFYVCCGEDGLLTLSTGYPVEP